MSAATHLFTDDLAGQVDRYIADRKLTRASVKNLRTVVSSFERWLIAQKANSRFKSMTDLDRVNTWLCAIGRTRSPATINTYKSSFLRLLRFVSGGEFAADGLNLSLRISRQRELMSDKVLKIVRDYVNARELCPKQRERLIMHARLFERWVRTRPFPPAKETESERLSAWLAELSEVHAPSTVNNYRQSIIGLLRFATPDGVALPRADRIRRQKEPQTFKPAFTKGELLLLIEAAPKYLPMQKRVFGRGTCEDEVPRHRPDGITWARWWEAFVRIGYESGQYLSDLRRIPWNHLAPDGSISFVRHKTGKALSFRLSEESIHAARALNHPDRLLPWNFNMSSYFSREFLKFVRSVPGVRPFGPKSIRRSAITYTFMEQGEEAARLLAGHFSFATTAKHYIDWSIARRKIVHPPTL